MEGEVPVTALNRPPNKAYRDLHIWICHLTKKASAISLKLGSGKPKETFLTLPPKTLSVTAAVNEDEDSEPEKMPPEAKMRMKDTGSDTSTSTGQNSLNKGKYGFSDNQKLCKL